MFLLAPLLLLSLATSIHSLSAPECADGSISVCTCGDGNPPDFSTFPPCDIKKVSINDHVYFSLNNTLPCFFLRASPSVSAPEVEASRQSTSNRSQRGLATLAGSTVEPCQITKWSPFYLHKTKCSPLYLHRTKCAPFVQ